MMCDRHPAQLARSSSGIAGLLLVVPGGAWAASDPGPRKWRVLAVPARVPPLDSPRQWSIWSPFEREKARKRSCFTAHAD